MAVVTTELMYEVLRQMRSDIAALKEGMRETTCALNAIGTHMLAMRQDTPKIYAILVRHETRLDRIERRLEIAEAPA